MDRQNIAVIGAGISGLSAAWLLSKKHRVTLYEIDNRLGGHANTLRVETDHGSCDVDTGFIVFNDKNYPNLIALFDALNVKSDETDMGFAFSMQNGAYEYSGNSANAFFGQRKNLFSRNHWQLLIDIRRFFSTAQEASRNIPDQTTLGDFLKFEGYSDVFIHDHIIPMGAAIWSTPMSDMLDFPARSFISFYANHGLLQFEDRPKWRTVSGGSKVYVDKLIEEAGCEVQKGFAVQKITRHPNHVLISDGRGATRPFDNVVIATHATDALKLLGDPSADEHQLLGAFPYQVNEAVLHRDPRWMPKRKRIWSSWNYLKSGTGEDSELCMTYWMNSLQRLPTGTDFFVTLNPTDEIHPKAVDAVIEYDHPVFSASALTAQKQLHRLQGVNRTWFCGSYFGYGFHEDGAVSGLQIAEQLGGLNRPWERTEPDRLIAYQSALPPFEAAE